MTEGAVIINAREICLLSYTNSVDFYVSELFVFSLFFSSPSSSSLLMSWLAFGGV